MSTPHIQIAGDYRKIFKFVIEKSTAKCEGVGSCGLFRFSVSEQAFLSVFDLLKHFRVEKWHV